MMHNDDYFTPETVDEQVERILQMQDPQETTFPTTVSLVQELNDVCVEDAALLERVWERYAAHITAQPTSVKQRSIQTQQKKEHIMPVFEDTREDTHETTSATSTHKGKRRRLSRIMALVNGVAAVLVVSLLIVGSVLLFQSRHQTNTGANGTPSQPVKTLPPSRCSTLLLDPGEMSLCQAGQFNELDLTGSVDGYTINMIGGYADAGRIFLANQVTNKKVTSNDMLNGMETLTVQGIDVLGGPTAYSSKGGSSIEGVSFDVSDLAMPAASGFLHLKFEVQFGFEIPNPAHTGKKFSVTPPIILNFSLPFHAEKRVANLHVSSSIANGEKVTLEHVLVTPSETVLTMLDDNPNGVADLVGELSAKSSTLTIGATKVLLAQVDMGAGVVGNYKQSLGGHQETVKISLSVGLLDQHGAWVLKLLLQTPNIEGQAVQATSIGTLVFHFMVP